MHAALPPGRGQVPPPPRKPRQTVALPRTPTCLIGVLFLRQTEYSAQKSAWNRAVEWYTGYREIHCELYFPHTRETCRLSSAEPVEIVRGRRYNSQDWIGYYVRVTPEGLDAAYRFCQSQVGKGFDRRGRNLFWFSELFCCGNVWMCSETTSSPIPPSPVSMTPPDDDMPSVWVCSRLTCVALKKAGIFRQVDEWRTTPGELRELLQIQAENTSKGNRVQLTGMQKALGVAHVTLMRLPAPAPSQSHGFLGSS